MTGRPKTPASLRPAAGFLFLLASASDGAAQTRLTKPIIGKPVAIVAPATLAAESPLPTRIHLTWLPVAGAVGYRVTGTNSFGNPDDLLYEGAAGTFAVDPGMCSVGMPCQYIHTRLVRDILYSYRVYSVFAGAPAIYSGPGPVASARPAPFVAPANLRATVVPSTAKPGALRVTLTWDAVGQAVGYSIVSDRTTTRGFVYPVTVAATSLILDGRDALLPRQQYSICVSTIYPFKIENASVRSCVTVG